MGTTTATTATLSSETRRWIAAAPPAALDALLHPAQLRLVLDAAYANASKRGGVHAEPLQPKADRPLRVVNAIRTADLRCRRATGKALEGIRDYETYRVDGSPSRAMIYAAFGSWPHALLAARDDRHADLGARRARGGDWTNAEFNDAQLERAVLRYAEQHAGCLPGKNKYHRWQDHHRPDLPSAGQITKRTNANNGNGRPWGEVQAAAARRAVTENGWPLTRARLEVERVAA